MISIAGNSMDYWKDSGIEDSENFLSVNSCGYQRFISKDFSILRKEGRLDFQIIYIIKGKGYFKFNNEDYIVEEGNIVVFSPNEVQDYCYRACDKTELYWIHFTGFCACKFLDKFGLLQEKVIHIGMSSECEELFKKIIYELQIKRDFHGELISGFLIELMAYAGRKASSKDKKEVPKEDKSIKKVLEQMQFQYNSNRPVSQYAEDCSLSLYRFVHKFKEVTGMTPLGYITRIRINAAKELLSNSSFSISEISSLIGYQDSLYFSRVFKKETELSPTEYRKKNE